MQKATFALVDDGRIEVSYSDPTGTGALVDIVVNDMGDGYEVRSADINNVLLASFPKTKVLYWANDLASIAHG